MPFTHFSITIILLKSVSTDILSLGKIYTDSKFQNGGRRFSLPVARFDQRWDDNYIARRERQTRFDIENIIPRQDSGGILYLMVLCMSLRSLDLCQYTNELEPRRPVANGSLSLSGLHIFE
jgi:hypothetical protein